MAVQLDYCAFTEGDNILPAAVAASELALGTLVYLTSAGQWDAAVAVLKGNSGRTDALGVMATKCAAGAEAQPVRRCVLQGYSGLTIGAPIYLTATAGSPSATNPGSTYIQQRVGTAIAANKISYEIEEAETVVGGQESVVTLAVSGNTLSVAGIKVLGAQGISIADASGGSTVDAQARTAINSILARLRAHGLISTT